MELTPHELKALVSPPENQAETPTPSLGPQQIVVLDRGFVYVGNCEFQGSFLLIHNARNIRVWGTTKGLGQLVDSPADKTILDNVGEVIVPLKALIHIIKCSRSW